MIRSRRKAEFVVIHFDAAAGPRPATAAQPSIDEGRLARIRWYCEWTAERRGRVLVALPVAYQRDAARWKEKLSPFPVHWCGEPIPDIKVSRNIVWLIDGDQMPIIDWAAASTAAHGPTGEVVVFGHSQQGRKGNYPESVVLDADGQVLRFQRHYFDSQRCVDRFGGRPAYLATRSDQAAEVIEHVCARGWGMESIGALTVRFQIRWSYSPCLLTGMAQAGAPAGPPARSSADMADRRQTDADSGGNGHWRLSHSPDSHGPDDPPGTVPKSAGFADAPCEFIPEDHAYTSAKRVVDFTAAALGLLLLSPLLLLIALSVKVTSPGPVLFGHKRQGLRGREFRCWKFRSMRSDADQLQSSLRAQNEVDGPQFKMTHDPRITPLGALLRKTNLDELPQLINVLLGSMSLVGPRPSPDAENQYCPAWRKARLSVQPGITGLWQVFRNRRESASDFQEWIYYDVEYARHRCMGLDFFILLCTLPAILAPSSTRWLRLFLEERGICAHAEQMNAAVDVDRAEVSRLSPVLVNAVTREVDGKHYDSVICRSS